MAITAEAAASRRRRMFSLNTALAALVLATVTTTALLIHLSWSYTARGNVADVVQQLNRQIAMTVRQEVLGVVGGATSLQETLRLILARGALMSVTGRQRDALLLPLLRSQPGVSWIALGLPDGAFFGAQKIDNDEIDLVEVHPAEGPAPPRLQVERYHEEQGDWRLFERRESASDYDPTGEDWYKHAVASRGPEWTRLPHLPNSARNAISTATPLIIGNQVEGVITVAIEVDRLSRFLMSLEIGEGGAVAVLDPTGYVVASPDEATIREQRGSETPHLDALAARNPPMALVAAMARRGEIHIDAFTEERQRRVTDPVSGADAFVTLTPLIFEGWVLATVIPADTFLARIDRHSRRLLAGLGALTLAIATGATLAAQRLVGRPLGRIAGQLKHIEHFELHRIGHVPSALREVDDFSTALQQMARGLDSFRKYIPADLVRILVAQGIEAVPGGSHRRLTVMFTDLAGFTGLSERLGAAIVPVLTDFLDLNTRAILASGGTIDKFIGDAIMAFWGAPIPHPDHALAACTAALEARARLGAGTSGLHMRTGINTGTMLVGNIGSADRLGYTVIGDAVNVASRIEALGKQYGTGILIGEDTRADAGAAIRVRRLDRVAVHGRVGGTVIYELLSLADQPLPAWVAAYETGLAAYEARDWAGAIGHFQAAITARGQDRASEVLIARCRALLDTPPPPDWQPVARFEGK